MSKKIDMQKFEGNKPLLEYPNDYYPDKLDLYYNKFETEGSFDRYETMRAKRVELGDKKIVFGCKGRPEEFTKYDFLNCTDGYAFVVHNRVLDKFNKFCPNDIQALPMVIKNLDPGDKPFENTDFWLINVLHSIDAVNIEKSEAKLDDYLMFYEYNKKMYLKDVSCFKGHLIGMVKHDNCIIFHPSLAKQFIKSKGVQFLTDEEAPL